MDIFDHYDEQFTASIRKKPEYQIDVAFDHKINLQNKARSLQLHHQFVTGDGNRPLPFEDNSFQSVFSNIIYWLDNPADAFKEISRILFKGGKGCVMLPDINLKEFSFYYAHCLKNKDERFRFLELMDRGRLADNIKNTASEATWKQLIESAGLDIIYHRGFLSKPLIQTWDIGLRPLFPTLHKMVSHIPSDSLPAIKQEWIATLKQFLEPMAELDASLSEGNNFAFHCFIFQK